MDYTDVNFLSKRPLTNGERYEKYFKGSTCKAAFLGTNDTAFTVEQMKKWAYKNADQTKALSLAEFSNKNL